MKRGEWHEEARRLRAEGWTLAKIGEQLGVSAPAVSVALRPEAAEKNRQTAKKWRENNPDRWRSLVAKHSAGKRIAAGRAVAMTWADGRSEVLKLRPVK